MKSTLSYIALFSAFGIAAAAGAETAGFATSSLAYALPFSAFMISLVLLTFADDYSRSIRRLYVAETNPVLNPANEAFGSTDTVRCQPAIRRRSIARRTHSVVAHG